MSFDRKPGTLLEIFGDFWLGVAGAGAKGFAHLTERRREERAKREPGKRKSDFYETAAGNAEKVFEAARVVFVEAAKTAEQTHAELKKAE